MSLDRPILITGVSRSGKTLLANILKRTPEFAMLFETLSIWNTGMGVQDTDCRTAAEVTDTLRRQIIGACEKLVTKHGKTRYADTLSYHALRLPFIHAIAPEAKFLHVYRSGEAVIPEIAHRWTSKDTIDRAFARRRKILKLRTLPRLLFRFAANYIHCRLYGRRATYGPRVPGLKEFARGRSAPVIAAYQWRRSIEIFHEDAAGLPDRQWMEVCFEHMVSNPAGVLPKVAAFCEVEDPHVLVQRGIARIDADHEDEAQMQPTLEEWQQIHEIIAPLQEKLGYSTSTGKMSKE